MNRLTQEFLIVLKRPQRRHLKVTKLSSGHKQNRVVQGWKLKLENATFQPPVTFFMPKYGHNNTYFNTIQYNIVLSFTNSSSLALIYKTGKRVL